MTENKSECEGRPPAGFNPYILLPRQLNRDTSAPILRISYEEMVFKIHINDINIECIK